MSMAMRFEQRLVLVCVACGGDHGVGEGHWPRESAPRDIETGALCIPMLKELGVCPVCFSILAQPVDWAPILKHYEKLQRRKGLREYRRAMAREDAAPVPKPADRLAWFQLDGVDYPVTIVAETAQRFSVRAESLIPISTKGGPRWILAGGFALVPKQDVRAREP